MSLLKIVCLVLFVVNIALPQNKREKLAVIGKREITTGEFSERFELTPQLGIHRKNDIDLQKKQFLYTLIAEKLWAQKAGELGYDTLAFVQSTYKYLEKLYARDALYKQEITDKVIIPEQELLRGYFKNSLQLKLDYLATNDEKLIKTAYNMLIKGMPFDSLHSFKDSVLSVSFGQMIEPIEDSLYKLTPGQFTAPISTPLGWYIFRLREKTTVEMMQSQESQSKVKKIVQERITDKVYEAFYKKFFDGKEIHTNGLLFWKLSRKIIDILQAKKIQQEIADSEKVFLGEQDFATIKKEFGSDSLKLVYINLDKQPVTLNQFIDDLSNMGFFATYVDSNRVRNRLNSAVRTYIEQEMLAREALKRGIQNLPEVKNSLTMWKDYYLCQLFRQQFIDSSRVSEAEAYNYYKQNNREITVPKMIKIVEILTDSLEVVEKVLNALSNDADIRELAKQHTKRASAKDNAGEIGFISVNALGEIGKIAADMEIGEVYGPLKIPEGYSVFKLIDKKEEEKKEPKPFEEIKDEVKMNLMASKLESSVIKYTIKLANDYGVSVNENLLNEIKVSTIPMFAYRFMGFGGRITAVPLSSPFNDWVDPWIRSKTDLP